MGLFRKKGPTPEEVFGATKQVPQFGGAYSQGIMHNPMVAFQPPEKK
jgi:hypothetical protein